MDEKQPMYSMSRLIEYTELDALAAQKNAGSRSAYFTLLTEFVQNAMTLIHALSVVGALKNYSHFYKRILILQEMLLSVGATGLLWEAEKVAELAQKNKWEACAVRSVILFIKIKHLRTKMYYARVDLGVTSLDSKAFHALLLSMAQEDEELKQFQIPVEPEQTQDPEQPQTSPEPEEPQAPPEPKRLKAPIEPERFEKLRPLIAHFETDQALDLLQELMCFSYSTNIDAVLAALHDSLSNFEQDRAERYLKHLLKYAKAANENMAANEKKKILAIDDMPDILVSIKSILKNDYAIYGVTNHMAALKVLSHNSPDLILLDIDMPDMDGFTLLGLIRAIKAYENTPVLFLTGNVTVENIVRSRKAGGNDFLKKPIDAEILLAKVKKHLEDAQPL